MTELSFAKSFLSSLDAKPTKLSADHIEDPRRYPARSVYILPKLPKPLPKRQKIALGSEPSISVTLKSSRNPVFVISVPGLATSTSILNLKEEISKQKNLPVEKLRVLYNRKAVGDTKILKEVVEDKEEVEFLVMVMGGASATKKDEEVVPEVGSVAQGESGRAVLRKEEFWGDLKGFLVQRLRDESESEKVYSIFRKAWEKDGK
ncbi:cell-cycle control medial ring component-domain-containing protein [Bisporella sp. PMI_857]|nr:cell-cycle control medial ring component-domain-containing protein [Bisporella sp. PMI_857]